MTPVNTKHSCALQDKLHAKSFNPHGICNLLIKLHVFLDHVVLAAISLQLNMLLLILLFVAV